MAEAWRLALGDTPRSTKFGFAGSLAIITPATRVAWKGWPRMLFTLVFASAGRACTKISAGVTCGCEFALFSMAPVASTYPLNQAGPIRLGQCAHPNLSDLTRERRCRSVLRNCRRA